MPSVESVPQGPGKEGRSIEGDGNLVCARALAMYGHTSCHAAVHALRQHYPVVASLVGVDAFAACAARFAEKVPFVDTGFGLYGASFAGHLARWPLFGQLPYLPAVALLEWLVAEARSSRDMRPLDFDMVVRGFDMDEPLRLHPAARTGHYAWPAADLWRAHQPRSRMRLDEIEWGPQAVLVTRPAFDILVQPIDEASYAFLTAPTFREGALAALRRNGDVTTIFASLIVAGAFAASAGPHVRR